MSTDIGFAVRDVQAADLPGVVRVHQLGFRGFLMTAMGPRFLRAYYTAVYDYPDRIFLVIASADGSIRGFVAGFANPPDFYRLFSARKKSVMASALLHVALRPSIWARVLGNMRQVQGRASHEEDGAGVVELASIAVDPTSSRMGFGKSLVRSFVDRAKQLSMRRVVLTTDTKDNDSVNLFYQELGFRSERKLQRTGGRVLNEYVHIIE